MGAVATKHESEWPNVGEYPFEPKRLSVEGGRIHYIDEGKGPVLIFVHGSQTWSFLFRHLIRELRNDYRCVAIDHLGFGLSDKPSSFAGTPAQHARNLGRLVDHLQLTDINLVAHDCGGPIALSYAEGHVEKIRSVVLMNTWMWGLKGDQNIERSGKFVLGGLGEFMFTNMNLASKSIKPLFHDKAKFTESAHDAYFGPCAEKEHRLGPLRMAQCVLKEHEWYEDLWVNRTALEDIPKMLIWGAKDPRFGERYMNRVWSGFPLAQVHRLDDCGHFPPEECPSECVAALRGFLR